MTRYTDEWLDAKLMNIQRWKREEAARSAAKQSTGAGAPHAHGEGARQWPVTSRHEAAVAHAPATPTSTAGAASPAGVPSTPVAAPAPDDVQWICAGGVIAASSGTKYRNKPTDGYASKREAKRAAALRLMQEAGQIRDLREQVEFLLIPRQTRPDGTAERSCSYWADFVYDEWTSDGWKMVVEDVKGVRTSEYVIKRKLMLMVHGVGIREV